MKMIYCVIFICEDEGGRREEGSYSGEGDKSGEDS